MQDAMQASFQPEPTGNAIAVLRPEQLVAICGGELLHRGDASVQPTGVAFDSRRCGPGEVFVAFAGEHADGHAFVASASAQGCRVAIVSDAALALAGFDGGSWPDELWVVRVDDPYAALRRLAAAQRELLTETPVVAVTGSVGKTTTCAILGAVLGELGEGVVPRGSFNNSLGVPVTMLGVPEGSAYAVCEVGMNAPGEIRDLGGLVSPDVCVITGAGRAHLEGVGSVQGVAREKASLAACVNSSGLLSSKPAIIVNSDGVELVDAVRVLIENSEIDAERVVWYGENGSAMGGVDVAVEREDAAGVVFRVERDEFVLPMPGSHNAMNAAAAVLVARSLGMGGSQIADGLKSVQSPAMRMEQSLVRGVSFVNDAYNANPESMLAAMTWFCGRCAERNDVQRAVLVLGDMLELGDESAELHREVLAALADLISRQTGGTRWIVELVGPMMTDAASALHGHEHISVTPYDHVPGRGDGGAIGAIARGLCEGDAVLLKGSRGLALERVLAAWTAASTAGEGSSGGGR